MLYIIIYIIIYYALNIKVKLPIQKVYEFNYSNKLYIKWLNNHLKRAFNHLDIYAGILTIISFYVGTRLKIILLILAIILIIYDTENIKYTLMIDKETIKIPIEKRIIRLLLIYIIVMIIPFIMGLLYTKYKILYIGIGIILLVFSYLFILLTNLIMTPIESLIKKIVITKVLNKIKKLNINFIGIIGKYGKSSLANILDQLIDSKTYVINNLDELYKIKFKNNDYIIIKINCINNAFKKIMFNNIICTKEFDIEDLEILNNINKDNIYFYKQNKLYKQIDNKNIYYYGDKNSLINLIDYKLDNNIITFTYNYNNKLYKDKTKILGFFNIYHILSVILLLDNLNINYKNKINKLIGLKHSLSIKELNGFTMIDDTYHTNSYSFIEGLKILNNMKGTKVLVTPGLLDNSMIIKDIIKTCDYIILIGEKNTKELYRLLIDGNYKKERIYITNDYYESYAMISNLNIKGKIYALYENNMSNLYKE